MLIKINFLILKFLIIFLELSLIIQVLINNFKDYENKLKLSTLSNIKIYLHIYPALKYFHENKIKFLLGMV